MFRVPDVCSLLLHVSHTGFKARHSHVSTYIIDRSDFTGATSRARNCSLVTPQSEPEQRATRFCQADVRIAYRISLVPQSRPVARGCSDDVFATEKTAATMTSLSSFLCSRMATPTDTLARVKRKGDRKSPDYYPSTCQQCGEALM